MHRPTFRAGLLLLAITAAIAGDGMGISPPLVLIDDVRPGTVIDLGAKGLRYAVHNQGEAEQAFTLEVVAPAAYSLKAFEAGYEPLPSAAWLTLARTSLVAPGKGSAASGVTLHIPDEPEHWNRHYVVYVEVGVGGQVALGATLRVRARLLIETAVREGDAAGPASLIAVSPGRVEMAAAAGGGWQGGASVRNQGPAATFDVLSMAALYPGPLADRRPRYIPGYVAALADEEGIAVDQPSFALGTGESRALRFTATAAVAPGDKPIDVVRFIARRAAPGATDVREVAGQRYDRIELVRLRHPVKETAKAP
jgi:hypothetical protein